MYACMKEREKYIYDRNEVEAKVQDEIYLIYLSLTYKIDDIPTRKHYGTKQVHSDIRCAKFRTDWSTRSLSC